MKCKVVRHRITIPTEIRNRANILDGEYLDIDLDENTGIITIKRESNVDNKVKSPQSETKVTKNSNIDSKSRKPAAATNKKIEANFMDADKLYNKCFSECGLLVRTKRSYVRNACEKCKGKLAEDWSDRVEIHCSYLENKYKDRLNEQDDCRESTNINSIRKQAKKDIDDLSSNIKKAVKSIDNQINDLKDPVSKIGRVKITNRKSKSSKKNNLYEDTIIEPIAYKDESVRCTKCGLYYSKGFNVGDEFMCKSCTIEDFKDFMKKYRKVKGDK